MKRNVFARVIFMIVAVVMAIATMAVAGITASAATEYTYKLSINTANVSKAGTDKDVYLYAYDSAGEQIGNRIKVDTKGNSFEKGDTDVVTITLPKAMKSVKVATFGHADNFIDSFEDDWKLDNIVADLMNGDKVISTTTYEFDQWIECGWYSYVSGNKFTVDEVERLYSPANIIRENGFEYAVLSDGTAEILSYTGSEKEIVVPEFIDGYKVTRINDSAFEYNSTLRSVTIPNSVTSIGNYAFNGCVNLTDVVIPDSVTTIGNRAFSNCIMLENIDIPHSVKNLGHYAFLNCESLNSVNLSDNLTTVEASVFEGCNSLTNIEIPHNVTKISENAFKDCNKLSDITVPENLASIEGNAFSGCPADLCISGYSKTAYIFAEEKGIEFCAPVKDFRYTVLSDGTVEISCYYADGKFVVVPETIDGRKVTSIGEQAFMLSPVETVIIPDSVKEINYLSFALCDSLTDITMPEDLCYIGVDAFAHCHKLEGIEIPAKTECIMNSAFSNCTALKSITIPESVRSIGEGAFFNCESLSDVTISNVETYIGDNAFENCSASLVIKGYTGSYAEKYAEENNVDFSTLN